MIYFISDLHLCHNRTFVWGKRGFNSVEEMNNAIVERWNNVVTDDDDVFVLGDLILQDNETGAALIRQLKGKIHIILGNHDTDNRKIIYNECPNVMDIAAARYLKYQYNGRDFHFFLCHYPVLCSPHDSFGNDKHLSRNIINLCGHTHTSECFKDFDKGYIYHCDCDALNCTPKSIEQIIEEIKAYIEQKENFDEF